MATQETNKSHAEHEHKDVMADETLQCRTSEFVDTMPSSLSTKAAPQTGTTCGSHVKKTKSPRATTSTSRPNLEVTEREENDTAHERINLPSSLECDSRSLVASIIMSLDDHQPLFSPTNNEERLPASTIHQSASLKSSSSESGNDTHFLEKINDTLGPLQPDASDPIGALFSESYVSGAIADLENHRLHDDHVERR
jgi:hypothetical protein